MRASLVTKIADNDGSTTQVNQFAVVTAQLAH